VKFVPLTSTKVPTGPDAGLTKVTVGAGGVEVNRSLELVTLVPPPVVTVTSTVPALAAGEVADIEVALVTVKVAAVAPKLTALTPVKLVPVMVTGVPPAVGPDIGLTPVTVGGGGGPAT
jgi:hypothetical protein